MLTKFWSLNLKGNAHLGDLVVDRKNSINIDLN
jgi:hypothetical protein